MQLGDSVTVLPNIKQAGASKLAKLGIETVCGLLTYFPRYIQDNAEVLRLDQLQPDTEAVVKAQIHGLRSVRIRGGRTLQTALVVDDTNNLQAMWFNQPFLVKQVNAENWYLLKGKLKQSKNKWVFYPTQVEQADEGKETLALGRLTPVYPLTAGVTVGWLRKRIYELIQSLEQIQDLPNLDFLQQPLTKSLTAIHFPESEVEYQQACGDLGLTELVDLQLKVKQQLASHPQQQAPVISGFSKNLNQFLKNLPWELTPDQATAINELIADLSSGVATQRLLQGDVGSGKTIVAIAASLAVASAGYQVAILAPTTVLAQQHYQSFQKYLAQFNVSVALVTANTKTDTPHDILIGTAAVLARKQNIINNLGLVVVDEQHRFGVRQREELLAPFTSELTAHEWQPYLLNMTATPIPRTLALSLFSTLQVSTISTKPKGRLPIKTFIVPETKREDSISWINEQLQEGGRVYWICPLVEEGESDTKAATQTCANLTQVYPQWQVGLLHGRMKAAEKEAALADFASGKTHILVSTSVVEVGIDVPEATVIVIEGAERFGLAQLHQLRGRVGRSDQQSWCLLYTTSESVNPDVQNRLEYFANHTDGLEIALYDLQRRGPGEVYGTKQAGIPNLKIAKLDNLEQIKQSQQIADRLWQLGQRQINLFNC
jgi:ATP-dependent DNA helicase RecG